MGGRGRRLVHLDPRRDPLYPLTATAYRLDAAPVLTRSISVVHLVSSCRLML
jgi:hypothetical protein